MSLALSFAYAEEIGIDRAGFGTAVTVSAANVVSERYCGDTYNGTNLDWVVATLYDDGRLVITGKKGYISNINAGRLCGFINDNVNQMNKINKIIIKPNPFFSFLVIFLLKKYNIKFNKGNIPK